MNYTHTCTHSVRKKDLPFVVRFDVIIAVDMMVEDYRLFEMFMPYSIIDRYEHFFHLEDGSSRYLQNADTYLPNYVALHVRIFYLLFLWVEPILDPSSI
jgi:hypothetical protein